MGDAEKDKLRCELAKAVDEIIKLIHERAVTNAKLDAALGKRDQIKRQLSNG